MDLNRMWFLILSLTVITTLGSMSANAENRIAELEQQVRALAIEIQEIKREQGASESATNQLAQVYEEESVVDLSTREVTALDKTADGHVLARPWWRNIDITGFAAAGFYDTGSAGTRRHGGFEVKESSFFINADVWENTSLFMEVQANRLGKDDQLFVRTGEVYLHFRKDQLGIAENVGLKFGRIDIPFGEEYLAQDSIDNPLVTTSASYIYGWDEGILAHATIGAVDAIVAITDGTDARSAEDHDDKAINLKFTYKPRVDLTLSVSAMSNGKAQKSAVEFGGSHFQPVGASRQSSAGISASEVVNSFFYQVDGRYAFNLDSVSGSLAFSAGAATVDDQDSLFDRDFRWFTLQPLIRLSNQIYFVLRYSEIGTYDSKEGYHFDGKTFAGGNSAFGYDTKRFQRLGFGLGWVPHPRMVAKLEIGRDRFELIDASLLDTNNDDRTFTAFEIAVKL